MSKVALPYYPPRARWYAPFFYFTRTIRLVSALDRIHFLENTSWRGLFGCLLVPGMGFYLHGPRLWGKVAMGTCAFLFLIFIVWLGYPIANLGLGMIVSIHVSSIIYYCSPFANRWELKRRLLFSVTVLIAVGFGLYSQLRNVIQDHWLTPVSQNGHIIVVAKTASADKVRRGDDIAYMLSGYYLSNHMGSGRTGESRLGLGPVLAVAGDTVIFSNDSFSVNGVSQLRLSHMPQSGAFLVQPNHWFIWPIMNLVSTQDRWAPGEDEVSSAMLQLSDVSKSQYIGKPLKHWFWRKQIIK